MSWLDLCGRRTSADMDTAPCPDQGKTRGPRAQPRWLAAGFEKPAAAYQAGLLGLASPAISVGATFATLRLLAMSFITFLTALAFVPSGLSIPICFRMLKAPCVCSCGIRTKRLLAIASQPFCKWPRHEHRSVLISQAG